MSVSHTSFPLIGPHRSPPRLRSGYDLGATIAPTWARPLTSSRIVVKAGFSVHGQGNCYRLGIG
ncbi:MAG TPA: hypothetical protein VII65_07855 [Acidimicrobiales bacterium]